MAGIPSFDKEKANKVLKTMKVKRRWLAGEIGIDPTTLSGYLTGRNVPPYDIVLAISQRLKIDPKEFFREAS